LDDLLRGGRIEIIADGVNQAFSDSVRGLDATVSFHGGRLIVDMPEEGDVNGLIDGVRTAKGNVVSVIPRRRRLEDLFIETVSSAKGKHDGEAA
jgi:ABC-2 type transport system ATP-binding protein